MGPAAAGAIDALRKEHDNEELEGCIACWALARIEPENKEARAHAIEMLLATVNDKNPRVQSAAVRGLLDLRAPPEQLVPALGEVILHGQEPAVGEALAALATMSDEAVPVLGDALKNRPEARARAAMLVAYLGPKAKEAVPALAAALADEDPAVRREVLFALAAIGADAASAAAAIQKSLADPETRNRATAAFALGRIGPSAAAAVPQLQAELTSHDPLVRVASAYGLVFVAPDNEAIARQALPVLMQGLQNPLAAARRGAAEALGRLGKQARGAEGALRMATHDPDESVRKAALEALEKIGAVVDAPPQQSAKPRK
jgi:HEAT repeat protein